MLLATTVSFVGLFLALAWLLAPQTTWFGAPTLETVRTMGSLAEQVGSQARQYGSPAPATPSLVLAGVVAVWASIFSCYALAFRAQSPILSLLPPLALVAFADGVLDQYVRPIFGVAFLVAALAVLFADSLRRIRSWGPIWGQIGTARDRLWPGIGRNGARVGLTVLAAALVAPVVVPGFGGHLGFDLYSVDGDGRIKVAPFASLAAVLNDPASATTPMFQIRADRGSYWRMIGLDRFDGATWEATQDEGTPLESAGGIPDAVAADDRLRQRVTVEGDMGFPWLIAAADPVSIAFDRAVTLAWRVLVVAGGPVARPRRRVQRHLHSDPTDGVAASGSRRDHVARSVTGGAASGHSDDGDRHRTVLDRRPAHLVRPGRRDRAASSERPVHLRRDGLLSKRSQCAGGHPHEDASRVLPAVRQSDGGDAPRDRHPIARRVGFHAGDEGWAYVDRDGRGPAHVGRGAVPRIRLALVRPHARGRVPRPIGDVRAPVGPGYGDDCAGSLGCGSSSTATPTPTHAPTPTPTLTATPGTQRSQPGAPSGSSDVGGSSMGSRFDLAALTALLLVVLAIGVPGLRSAHRRRRRRRAGDPRASILVTFELFAERARALGWGRRPDETVEEFRRRLISRGAVPDAHEPTLTLLASTVSAAAYGGRTPSLDDASLAERSTVSLLQALRAASSWHRRLLSAYR